MIRQFLSDDTGRQRRTNDEPRSVGCTLTSDDRGQSNIIGLAITVSIFAMLFVTAQTTLAPQVRQTTEFDHARNALGAMLQTQANTVAAAETDTEQANVIPMGGNYPSYLVLIHPSGPSGTLSTSTQRSIAAQNMVATDEEANDYLDGRTLLFDSTNLRFSPNYNNYPGAGDTVIAGTTTYQDYPNEYEVQSRSDIIDGRNINLVTTTGDISQGQSQPLLLRQVPLSAGGETVRVKPRNPGNPIQLSIPSQLPESAWRKMLADEIDPTPGDDDSKYVTSITKSGGQVIIQLERGAQYSLNIAKVGYLTGQQPSFPDSEKPTPTYMVANSDTDPTVEEGDTIDLVVEVRDEYSNPYGGATVNPPARTGGSFTDGGTKQTLDDGTVTYEYEAPECASGPSCSETVRISFGSGSSPEQEVEFDITVQNTDFFLSS